MTKNNGRAAFPNRNSGLSKHTIGMTGERTTTRVKDFFDEGERWISFLHFHILVRLTIARDDGGTGFVSFVGLYPKAACTLRKAIDQLFGDRLPKMANGIGDDFIESGPGVQYRLKFKPKGNLWLADDVTELIGMESGGVVIFTEEQYERLVQIAGKSTVITSNRR